MTNNISTLAFNGEYLDSTLDNYHLGNGYRAYNPAIMAFTAPDDMSPFGHGGINPYVYVSGDPINNTDPTGHLGLGGWLGVGGAILGLVVATGLSISTGGIGLPLIGAVMGGAATILDVTSKNTDDKKVATALEDASIALGALSIVTDILGWARPMSELTLTRENFVNDEPIAGLGGTILSSLGVNDPTNRVYRTAVYTAKGIYWPVRKIGQGVQATYRALGNASEVITESGVSRAVGRAASSAYDAVIHPVVQGARFGIGGAMRGSYLIARGIRHVAGDVASAARSLFSEAESGATVGNISSTLETGLGNSRLNTLNSGVANTTDQDL